MQYYETNKYNIFCVCPKSSPLQQFTYMWDYAQSYHLRPQTSISTSPPSSLVYPSVLFLSVLLSYSLQCPTPCTLTSASSYSPFLVVWPSLPSPLTHTSPCSPEYQGILTKFKGFPWNLFQTPDGVQEWIFSRTICSRVPILLGLCVIQTCFMADLHSANLLGTPRVLSP